MYVLKCLELHVLRSRAVIFHVLIILGLFCVALVVCAFKYSLIVVNHMSKGNGDSPGPGVLRH